MKWKQKLILISVFLILLVPTVLGSTIVLDKANYDLTETATATINCAGAEKNQAFTVNWTNSTGFQFQADTGDTGDCTTFLEQFTINSTYIDANGPVLNVTLSGSSLEGTDNATITTAGSNVLLISSITHRGTFIGLSSSIDSNVADDNGKAVSGGICDINVEDPTDDHVLETVRSPMIDGNLDFIWILQHQRFKEAKDYVGKISCFCVAAGGENECIDEDGLNVNNSIGSSDVAFTTSSWLTFNEDPFPTTLENGTRSPVQNLSAGYDDIHWLRNVSNNNPDEEPLEVRTRTILVKNDTKQIFGEINEGIPSGELDGFPTLNSTSFRNHKLSQLAETGVYFIRIIYDVIYKNQFQVAQYIKQTDPFNVTSIQDTVTLNEVTVEDFFNNPLNTSVAIQSNSTLPVSNFTQPFTMFTEGFHSEFCLNLTNNRNDEVEIFLDSLILENPTISVSKILVTPDNIEEADLINSTTEKLCFDNILPLDLNTHSDYRFSFEFEIGTPQELFNCETCKFTGHFFT